jgi:hypothetical protein
MMDEVMASAGAEADRGWGGPIALAVGGLLFWIFTLIHAKIQNPSPTLEDPPSGNRKRQVIDYGAEEGSSRSRGVVDLGWGGISYDDQDEADIDLLLENDDDDGGYDDDGETLAEYVARACDAGVPGRVIVRMAVTHFEVPEAVAKWEIKKWQARTTRTS